MPRDPATPRRARHYLAPRLSHLGMQPAAAAELLVAVGEAVTNAVLYGGTPDAGTVMVELIARRDRVAVAVSSPSARWHVPPATLPADPLASGGRGLYVMRHFADSVRIDQNRRGTTVVLIRRLRRGFPVSGAQPPDDRAATPRGHRRAG